MNIFKALETREYFEEYSKFVNSEIMSTYEQHLWYAVEKFFKDHPKATTIPWMDMPDYTMYGCGLSISSTDGVLLKTLCKNLNVPLTDDEEETKTNIINTFIDRNFSLGLSGVCASVSENSPGISFSDVEEMFLEWKENRDSISPEGEDHELIVDDEFVEDFVSRRKGLDWALPALNSCLGPLSLGFIVLGSRPDSGKTTLLLREAINFSEQLKDKDESVCWFHNEENVANTIIPRVGCLVSGLPSKELLTEAGKRRVLTEYRKWQAANDNTLKFYNQSDNFTVHDIEKFVTDKKAGVIFIDQLSKVGGYDGKYSDVDKFARVCKHLRRIANDLAPVIGTIWADYTAESIAYINMSQLYGSKTALQGEAEAVLTLGRTDSSPVRYLSCVKNKIPYGDPSMVNGKFELHFDTIKGEWK